DRRAYDTAFPDFENRNRAGGRNDGRGGQEDGEPMRLLKVLALILALGALSPATAQESGAGDAIVPIPPPRPAHLGGTGPAADEFDIENPFDDEDLPEGIVIDGFDLEDDFGEPRDF